MKLNVFSILLFPFSLLFGLIVKGRNFLFDKQIFLSSRSYQIPIICVGNLSVGGTGKTPVVAYLIHNLGNEYKIGVLSRGYGRKTKGFIKLDEDADADTVGDEPFQLYLKYNQIAQFFVCEDRVEALDIITKEESIDLVIMDDGFQHRYVKPLYSVILTDHSRPFFKDWLLPFGRLREHRDSIKRADTIIVTKCPNHMGQIEQDRFLKGIGKYKSKSAQVLFAKIKYSQMYSPSLGSNLESGLKDVVLLTGIANPATMVREISSKYHLLRHFKFPDHHSFLANDIVEVAKALDEFPLAMLVTTEKDWTRLSDFGAKLPLDRVVVLPIEIAFLENEMVFWADLCQKTRLKMSGFII